jgi:hypothetical protein
MYSRPPRRRSSAWVAARRSEVAERLAWRREIPELMAQLG